MATTLAARELQKVPQMAPSLVPSVHRILASVEGTTKQAGRTVPPRLVAVSKRQSVEKVQLVYREGVRHFGENYVQELHSKASRLQKLGEYSDIKWHFIGHLQRNKTRLLTEVPGLWMVETVDSVKVAQCLDRHWGLRESGPLRVMVQVNTSGEHSKHGCHPEQCVEVAQHISEECSHLTLTGLMTIGRCHAHHTHNHDFTRLLRCSEHIQESLHFPRRLELSMGMSADFQPAIQMGSTNIRIGTALFGPRMDTVCLPPKSIASGSSSSHSD